MGVPMRVRVVEVQCREWPSVLRLPFRFGKTTRTHGRQVVVRARIRTEDGRECWGQAAESLSAKWFDKNPALTDEQNHDQLRYAIELAREQYQSHDFDTGFGHFEATHEPIKASAAAVAIGPLTAGFGAALLDRCVIDAIGRLAGMSFWRLMRANLVGMRASPLAPELAGFDFDAFLAGLRPLSQLHVRHTVGLVDPIDASDHDPASGPDDGLPETLEQVVAFYGQRHFKVKIGGLVDADLARLTAIARVLDRLDSPYYLTLDGNEQYTDADAPAQLLRALARGAATKRLYDSIRFVEQPIERSVAMATDVRGLGALRPVIIDESDADLAAFPRAVELGYRGVSSKNCKGLYKSLVNRARCEQHNAAAGEGAWFMSAEDLTTLPGISLQQDLALVSLLGLADVERNAHHYVDGMRHRPRQEQLDFCRAHPDLYRMEAVADGQSVARLRIVDGKVDIGSLDCPGFACAVDIDWAALEPMKPPAWPASAGAGA